MTLCKLFSKVTYHMLNVLCMCNCHVDRLPLYRFQVKLAILDTIILVQDLYNALKQLQL